MGQQGQGSCPSVPGLTPSRGQVHGDNCTATGPGTQAQTVALALSPKMGPEATAALVLRGHTHCARRPGPVVCPALSPQSSTRARATAGLWAPWDRGCCSQ